MSAGDIGAMAVVFLIGLVIISRQLGEITAVLRDIRKELRNTRRT